MLVYANLFVFQKGCEVSNLLQAVADWLKPKTSQAFSPSVLTKDDSWNLPDRQRLQVWATDSEYPYLYSLRYEHPDRATGGRLWITEIGIRQESAESETQCSILLETKENSTRVATTPQVSCPGVVQHVVRACSLSPLVYGASEIVLDDSVVDNLRFQVDDPDRNYAIVLISPSYGDEYLLNIERLCRKVVGLASVIRIPPGYDTRYLGRMIGNDYAPWDGAASLIFPSRVIDGRRQVYVRKLLSGDLRAAIEERQDPNDEILSLLTHRSNLPLSWQHISPNKVKEAQLRREIVRRRKEASETGDQKDYVDLLEQTNAEQDRSLDSLTLLAREKDDEIAALEQHLDESEDEKRRLNFEIEGLKSNLSAAGFHKASDGTLSDEQQEALRAAFTGEPTLTQSLLTIETIWPDNVVILESAWASAKDSAKFVHRRAAFDLLRKLADEYRQRLQEGGGDSEGGKIFGNRFASNEGQKGENTNARKRRTFEYNGSPVEMMKHLKIGVKDSAAETLRIHFYWDAENERVVIGHCGKHLDHK